MQNPFIATALHVTSHRGDLSLIITWYNLGGGIICGPAAALPCAPWHNKYSLGEGCTTTATWLLHCSLNGYEVCQPAVLIFLTRLCFRPDANLPHKKYLSRYNCSVTTQCIILQECIISFFSTAGALRRPSTSGNHPIPTLSHIRVAQVGVSWLATNEDFFKFWRFFFGFKG